MKIGMIGLGKMGGNMAERLRRHGHTVVGMDPSVKDADAQTLEQLVPLLGEEGQPRIAWSMVPAGPITEDTIAKLGNLLSKGDIVIDGGNSNFEDSIRHGEELATKGVGFIDCGTSGGVWGLENGYCLMAGGSTEDIATAQPIFDALAPEEGFAHAGPIGSGHYVKMIHNGIEYGIMQSYAEGYAIMEACDLDIDSHAALSAWRKGSVVQSWLLDLLVKALEDNPRLKGIRGVAADSGEGRWTVNEAVRH
ncbi:MAG: NADP-dependent phosphogluconate dehydrogenase, partial [Actinomycetota bacterium]|nr:NADP-dependent phosphogluconate dehydrogenase [Actinomycetota bacterium]